MHISFISVTYNSSYTRAYTDNPRSVGGGRKAKIRPHIIGTRRKSQTMSDLRIFTRHTRTLFYLFYPTAAIDFCHPLVQTFSSSAVPRLGCGFSESKVRWSLHQKGHTLKDGEYSVELHTTRGRAFTVPLSPIERDKLNGQLID